MNFGSDFTYTPSVRPDGNYSDEEVPEESLLASLEQTFIPDMGSAAVTPPVAAIPPQGAPPRRSFFSRLSGSRNAPPRPVPPPPSAAAPPRAGPVSFPPAGSAPATLQSSAQRAHREKKLRGGARRGGRPRNYRQRVDTNVISVSLGTLGGEVTVQTGEPKICRTCAACLSNVSEYSPSVANKGDDAAAASSAGDDSYEWICEFCTSQNRVDMDDGELPVQGTNTVDFILEPALPTMARAGSTNNNNNNSSMVVFVLDVSGSMCVSVEVPGLVNLRGDRRSQLAEMRTAEDDHNQFLPGQRRDVTYISRMQAVQAAINAQLSAMAEESPDRVVGLVTFSSSVTVYGDGTGTPTIISGNRLDDLDELIKAGQEAAGGMTSLETSLTPLSDKLFSLEESGPTALGPAVAVSLGMAAGQTGAKIVLCTDGLANVGIGAIDEIPDGPNEARTAIEEFYTSLGHRAVEQGVIIDVISIQGDECDLENLGSLTDRTGGQVTRVDPFGLQNNFAGILLNPVLATNVKVTLLLHQGLEFRGEGEAEAGVSFVQNHPSAPSSSGTASQQQQQQQQQEPQRAESSEKRASPFNHSALQKLVGNATADTELSFEYQVKDAEERARLGFDSLSELPFQVQIEYTRQLDGMRCLRVISQKKPVTSDRRTAEANSKVAVLSSHAMQQTAKTAQEGDYYRSRASNRVWQNMMRRCAVDNQDNQRSLATWEQNTRALDEMVTETMAQEASSDEEELGDSNDDSIAATAPFPARSKSSMFKKKAARKASRSKNDKLSSVVYAAKHSNMKDF
mmetsp:Transcript_57313/g.78154  ORF Transcript_57313/g.78154 Transcript_57313/m.78154 type:complete len:794 (-) Transcript_57313:139-2520(-)